ncbi:MAG: hypothetical protein IPJ17_04640 [Holophagales bacterium]|nr:MAG: hypothetical protein IPJ17_04640 [Holophagales bacterium]
MLLSVTPSPRPGAARQVRRLRLAVSVVALGAASILPLAPARAATVCVGNSAELQNALDTAESNGTDDVIHLRTGTYPVPGGGFKYLSSESKSLTLVGGYITFIGGSCARLQSSPFGTVLDGGHQERVLSISIAMPAGSTGTPLVHIEGLKLANGDGGPGDSGVGLSVRVTPATVHPTIEVFGNASALEVYGTAGFDAAVTNNTFVGNSGGASSVVALSLANASATAWASNNILWANGGDYDFGIFSIGTVALVANDYPRALNNPVALEVDRYQVDPRFIDLASNWDLKPDSPLSGKGVYQPYGNVGPEDLLGRPRVTGSTIDLGAYEIQVLTADGFEFGSLVAWSTKSP